MVPNCIFFHLFHISRSQRFCQKEGWWWGGGGRMNGEIAPFINEMNPLKITPSQTPYQCLMGTGVYFIKKKKCGMYLQIIYLLSFPCLFLGCSLILKELRSPNFLLISTHCTRVHPIYLYLCPPCGSITKFN